MVPIKTTEEQETALTILRTSSSIATPEQLAALISSPQYPKYHKCAEGERIKWLGQQINALNYMTHSSRISDEVDLLIESSLVDQMIMEDEGMRILTFVEIQEAFRKGILKEYGEYYGISSVSLVSFLKGFLKSPKRQRALSILLKQEQQRVEEETARKMRKLYESRVNSLKLPFWDSSRHGNAKSADESAAHRKRIKEQRDKILREYKK